MDIKSILLTLFDLGHFRNPKNRNGFTWNIQRGDISSLSLADPAVREAIASYQSFMVNNLDPLTFGVHQRASIADGDVGPATEMLFAMKRCQCPDFPVDGASAATGHGSWPAGCYPNDWPDTHAIKIAFDTSGMRSWLREVFDSQVWPIVHKSFIDIGLKLIREDDNDRAHLQASFVVPNGNWIGLAIVPGGTSCTLSIWQRYDRDYRPRNLVNEWVTLVMHETGHNLNLDHTSGGIMNPGIINGLPMKWFGVGDPSEPILRRFFGGEPVDVPDPGPKTWTHQGFRDENHNEELWMELRPPLPR